LLLGEDKNRLPGMGLELVFQPNPWDPGRRSPKQPRSLRYSMVPMTRTVSSEYRADIDGLRALAILPVVFFHANLPGFSGGFVGVDVFFVISGYLITSVIQNDIRAGQFSIVYFYERRVRRIFPALFFMFAVCWVLASCLLYPEDYERFARSLVAATLFVSSFLFYNETGYFDGLAEEKPLLHTWSLSVEELYYIAFPVSMMLAWRLLGIRWAIVFAGLAVASFVGSILAVKEDAHSNPAFFLVHYRSWELLLGALLALYRDRLKIEAGIANWLGSMGVLLILSAVFFYTSETPFPGLAALVPCLGAALIILAGGEARPTVSRLLAWQPMVLIGLISYSLYLWHWPLLVFFSHWAGRSATYWEALALVTSAFVLAMVSWRWIERPFRGAGAVLSRSALFVLAAGLMLVMVVLGTHGIVSSGWPTRYGEEFIALAEAKADRDPRQEECLSPRQDVKGCVYGAEAVSPAMVLWGDSHAAVFAVTLGDLARSRNQSLRVFTMWSCPPLVGWQVRGQKWQQQCAALQEQAMTMILSSPSVRHVVIGARFAGVKQLPNAERLKAEQAFLDSLDRLLVAGKNVVIVYPVPELPKRHGVDGKLKSRVDKKGTKLVVMAREKFLAANRDLFQWLDNLQTRSELIRVYPHEVLCDQEYCYAAKYDEVYYFDQHHLSLTGAELVAPALAAVLYDNQSAEVGLKSQD